MIVRPAPWDNGPVLDVDWEGQELAPGARGHMATFARSLARACLSSGAQVVLSAATPWPRHAISIGDPAPLALDVVELMQIQHEVRSCSCQLQIRCVVRH